MTFRAKPVVKRSRQQWESQDRRNFLTNLAFGLVILAALLILGIAAGLTYYDSHLAAVGRIDGQAITKDDLAEREKIEDWRLTESLRRINTALGAGRLTEAQAAERNQSIQQQQQQLSAIALERIIDNRIQARLAAEEGITVAPTDIDAKLLEEATIPESRHLWLIEVEPAVTDGENEPTPTQIAAERNAAATALSEIQAGKAWEDVAKTVSTDTTTREQGGDLGWVENDDRSFDEAFLSAAFALEANATTDVLEGEDGIFRIARVTEISPETVDDLYQTKLANDGIDIAKYRQVLHGDVIRQKLEDKVVADVTKPGPQRRVAEIFIAASTVTAPEDGVKIRHILYAPSDKLPDPSTGEPVPSDDPGWAAAEAEAKATFERLKTDPELFDRIARTESDETSAIGTTGSGGKLGDFYGANGNLVEEFLTAILKPGLTDGQILEPVRTDFGWHVIQIMYRPPNKAQMDKLKTRADAGEDFAQLARDFSESQATSGSGGNLGWVARGQLDKKLVDAIFATEIGKTSAVVEVEEDGLYLFKVFEEQTRELEGRQLEDLRANAFFDWYQPKKDAVDIHRGADGTE